MRDGNASESLQTFSRSSTSWKYRNNRVNHCDELTINFMFPVPDASVPAVEICSDKSAAGMTFSAKETLKHAQGQ